MRNVYASAPFFRRHSASQRTLSLGGSARVLPGRRRLTFEPLEDRRLLSVSIDLNEMAPGRIIVGFADDVDLADASSIAESQGDRLLGVLPIIHGAVIDVSRTGGTGILPVLETTAGDTPVPPTDDAQVLANALDRWNASPLVRYAEPDYRIHPDGFQNYPNDPMLSDLWGLDRVRAPDSWPVSTGSREVVVAVIDSGVDYEHQDLAANRWRNDAEFYGTPGYDDDQNLKTDDIYGWDFRDGDSDPMDSDYGHGTHVAGIVGAVGNNGVGIVGVERNVKIMALRAGSFGGPSWVGGVVASLDYVTMMKTNHDVNIVAANISWSTHSDSDALRTAVANSTAEGIMCICSAGNHGEDIDQNPHYPASYNKPGDRYVPGIIAVAATDQSDGLAEFSNFGDETVDLAAPGVDIWSTWPTTPNPPPTPPNPHTWGYARWGGTSMAAPFVTGAVATVAAMVYRETTNVQQLLYVKGLITNVNNVDHLASLEDKVISEGRLNLLKVLCAVRKEQVQYDIGVDHPSVAIARWGTYGDLMQLSLNGTPAGSFPLAGTLSLTVNGSDYVDTISCQGLDLPNTPYTFPITLNGRGGQDTIAGSPAADTIDGGDGGGWISGLAGNDRLYGGAGDESINGGEGDDTIEGRGGNDSVSGEAGIDTITVSLGGGSNPVTIEGGADDDSITVSAAGGSRSITVNGDAGIDSITLDLGAGTDYVTIDPGYDNDYVTVNLADGSQSLTVNDYGGDDYVTVNLGDGSQWVTVNDYDGYDGNDSIAIYCGPGDDIASIGSGGIGNLNVSDGTYHVSGSGFENVTVDAGGGLDQTAYLYGTSADDTFTASPWYASMTDTESSYRVDVYGFRRVYAYPDYGTDSIQVSCGPGDDTATIGSGGIGNLDVTDGTFHVWGYAFENVTVDAGEGLDQTAYLYDTSADDTFTASYAGATMTDAQASYNYDVSGFRSIRGYGSYVYGQGGQGDTAEFYDSPADDTWVGFGHYNYSQMSDGTWDGLQFSDYTYLIRAQGFEIQKAYATAGGTGDTARLKDTPEHDVFSATGGVDQATGTLISITTLTAPQMSWQTWGFEYVYALKWAGGSPLDEAHFTHDPSGDYKAVFHAWSTYVGYMADVGMSGPGFFAAASHFNKYYGYGLLSTNDEALFRTTGTGQNTAHVWPTYAEMTGTLPATGEPVYLYASGFKKYFILRDMGDTSTGNVATLHGTSGNDTFTGHPTYCEMTLSTGVYYKVGYYYGEPQRSFDEVYVLGEGGDDVASLYDSAGDDTFWGHLADAVLSDGTLDLDNGNLITRNTYYYRLSGFGAGDSVYVYGSTGTNYKKIINPIDYALAFYGQWTDL